MLRDEIQRADQRIFWREVFRSRRVVLQVLYQGLVGVVINANPLVGIPLGCIGIGVHALQAQSSAMRKRFISPRFSTLWNGCRERFESFEQALAKLKKAEIAEFSELPKSVREVALSLYEALRRADILYEEVLQSEGIERIHPGVPMVPSNDAQAAELYRIAEKNLGEYKANYRELMSGISRTEAQAAVFMTTLDSLRVRMLSYRLVGRDPSMGSNEFLSALAEARAQLSAIDKALEDLDLTHYPSTISVVNPPPVPSPSVMIDVPETQEENA